MSDNLPLELLNNPLHITSETSPLMDPALSARDRSSSPVWLETVKDTGEVRRLVLTILPHNSMI